MTGVGCGDKVTKTVSGRLFTSFMAFSGLIFISCFTAEVWVLMRGRGPARNGGNQAQWTVTYPVLPFLSTTQPTARPRCKRSETSTPTQARLRSPHTVGGARGASHPRRSSFCHNNKYSRFACNAATPGGAAAAALQMPFATRKSPWTTL